MGDAATPDDALGRFRCDVAFDAAGRVRVLPFGELDLVAAPELDRELRAAATLSTVTVLDLRQVSFCDSTGLAAIIRAHDRAIKAGKRLVLVECSPQVRRLFELVGLDAMLEPATDVPSRLRA